MSELKTSQKGGEKNLNQFNKYLDNNIEVLHQKFAEYYGDPFPFQEVTSPEDLQFSIKYIYDVFNFGKYQANPTLNKTLKTSLITNVKAFVRAHTDQYEAFTPEVAVKLLKYCIQNNEMFAVHYDKKKQQKPIEENKSQRSEPPQQVKNEQKQPFPSTQQKQPIRQPKKQQVGTPAPQSPPKKQAPIKKRQEILAKSTMEQPSSKNEFLSQQAQKIDNTELINKQLKGVFQFYCKQQQSISPHSTFDNINHKCQTMNLGKFMAFAIASNLVHIKQKSFSQGKLDKRVIVGAYKKVAAGQRQIGFARFSTLMEELKRLDQDIYIKLGVGVQEPKGKSKLLEKLKCINLPFNTKDQEGREIMPHDRVFVPKLTDHSGKNQADLRDQLVSRKERAKCQPSEVSRLAGGTKVSSAQDQGIFSLKLGSSNQNIDGRDLNFLSRLIKQEEFDELYLKDYQLTSSKSPNLTNFDKHTNKSFDQRYDQAKTGVPFVSKSGALTSRKTKQRDFILPLITKRGMQTHVENQQHSTVLAKRFGDRSLLN